MKRLVLLASLVWAWDAQAAENLSTGEVVDPTTLRVCADPADLPFSNEAGEGFENKIAERMAEHMGRPLTYVWYPRTIGFVRQTLRARLCDLVMGVVSANELVQNTNPYYRSSYVMAVRADERDRYPDLSAPALRQATIGAVANTPPATMLAREGLVASIRSYHLNHDSRVDRPLKTMIEDLATGEIDVALGWGPSVGYWARNVATPIHLSALSSDDPRLRTAFRISMGVRWGEPEWKREINRLIRELQPEIDRILAEYHVPLVGNDGRLMATIAEDPPGGGVDEPFGYRTERYRAPVPSTLEGGTVLTTDQLEALIAAEDPILIDVLPKQRKSENRNQNMPWMEKKRRHLPGSIWLPNIGYGELSAEFADYFESNLAELTDGDPTRPLIFYCDRNCWMSYNAAKRAAFELGYERVYWYPDGVDGWKEAGLELVEGQEVPMPDFVR